jgi:hypothetical protein
MSNDSNNSLHMLLTQSSPTSIEEEIHLAMVRMEEEKRW